ncbi:hypothetical protein [Streptomyces sp. A012304]|nr:hypothetical protein [Streptomyces sp. A012304]GKQ40652.1 hypothetical protein ALMP_71750 [Streptomyces sp. A012304]
MPAEQRMLITRLIESAEEQLLQLRGIQTGPTPTSPGSFCATSAAAPT